MSQRGAALCCRASTWRWSFLSSSGLVWHSRTPCCLEPDSGLQLSSDPTGTATMLWPLCTMVMAKAHLLQSGHEFTMVVVWCLVSHNAGRIALRPSDLKKQFNSRTQRLATSQTGRHDRPTPNQDCIQLNYLAGSKTRQTKSLLQAGGSRFRAGILDEIAVQLITWHCVHVSVLLVEPREVE